MYICHGASASPTGGFYRETRRPPSRLSHCVVWGGIAFPRPGPRHTISSPIPAKPTLELAVFFCAPGKNRTSDTRFRNSIKPDSRSSPECPDPGKPDVGNHRNPPEVRGSRPRCLLNGLPKRGVVGYLGGDCARPRLVSHSFVWGLIGRVKCPNLSVLTKSC